MNEDRIILSGVHLELTDALKELVHNKLERLFRHEERIVRIRVELSTSESKDNSKAFTARGHIEIQGPDMHASDSSDDLYKSIDLMVDKLDRMLRQHSRKNLAKRKEKHPVDIPAELPKVDTA